MHTVLVIGGYGFFGGRICRALARNPAVRVLIGGRDVGSGRRLAQELGLQADQAVQIDANSPKLGDVLRHCQVRTVIHTAGPFQGQDYGVARSAIDSGCHYIDLADGRQFVVSGIGLDGQPHHVTWNLIAQHNHGPFVPCGASIVLATRLAAGEMLPVGAMPCLGLVSVAEYLGALEGLALRQVIE